MGRQGLFHWLRKRRAALESSLAARGRTHTLSLARYRLHNTLAKAIAEHARGTCLDAGSGRSPYKKLLKQYAEHVTSLDIEDRSGETDIIADVQSMPQLPADSFDTILCSQVLEHVPRPWDALGEFARLLRPQGILILTVPHLSVIHEVPHDYYRYTRYGLQALCAEQGLHVKEVQATGGLGCFLLHGVSAALLSTLCVLPLVQWLTLWFNYIFLVRLPDLVEDHVGLPALYPCDYLLLAGVDSSKDVSEGASQ